MVNSAYFSVNFGKYFLEALLFILYQICSFYNGQVTSRNLGLGVKFNIICPIQLRVPAELHAAGAVGDRVRDDGGQHPADHPAEQEPLPGPPTGVPRGIVSIMSNRLMHISISSYSDLQMCHCTGTFTSV